MMKLNLIYRLLFREYGDMERKGRKVRLIKMSGDKVGVCGRMFQVFSICSTE